MENATQSAEQRRLGREDDWGKGDGFWPVPPPELFMVGADVARAALAVQDHVSPRFETEHGSMIQARHLCIEAMQEIQALIGGGLPPKGVPIRSRE